MWCSKRVGWGKAFAYDCNFSVLHSVRAFLSFKTTRYALKLISAIRCCKLNTGEKFLLWICFLYFCYIFSLIYFLKKIMLQSQFWHAASHIMKHIPELLAINNGFTSTLGCLIAVNGYCGFCHIMYPITSIISWYMRIKRTSIICMFIAMQNQISNALRSLASWSFQQCSSTLCLH